MTLREIAKALGVSHATISLALRNHPRISESLRKRVRQKARELGYVPDPMLSALAHYRKNISEKPPQAALAWIDAEQQSVHPIAHPDLNAYHQGALQTAQHLGFHLDKFLLGKDLSPRRLEEILLARNIGGVLISHNLPPSDWGDFPWDRFAALYVGGSPCHSPMHVVSNDEVDNAIMAFEQIYARGYRRIGLISSEQECRWMFDLGFQKAQQAMPMEERLSIFKGVPGNMRERQAAFESWLEQEKPDAVLSVTEEVHPMLEIAGHLVPENVGFAVMSVHPFRSKTKSYAGLDPNAFEIGRVGLMMLVSLLNDNIRGIPPIPQQTLLQGRWIDGWSLPLRQPVPSPAITQFGKTSGIV